MIRIMQLTTGEAIIGTVVQHLSPALEPLRFTPYPNHTRGFIELEDVLMVIFDGENLGFGQFYPYANADAPVRVPCAHIVLNLEPAEMVLDQYKSIFSKIVTPSKSISTSPSIKL